MHQCPHHAPVVVIDPGDTCSVCAALASRQEQITALLAEVGAHRHMLGTIRELAAGLVAGIDGLQPLDTAIWTRAILPTPTPPPDPPPGQTGEIKVTVETDPAPPAADDARETARLKGEIQAMFGLLPTAAVSALLAEAGIKSPPDMPITAWRGRSDATRRLHEATVKATEQAAPIAEPAESQDRDDPGAYGVAVVLVTEPPAVDLDAYRARLAELRAMPFGELRATHAAVLGGPLCDVRADETELRAAILCHDFPGGEAAFRAAEEDDIPF